MKMLVAATTAALLMGTGAAFAQWAEFPWTEADFVVAYPDATPDLFTQLDTDGDGLLSEEEVEAGVTANLLPVQGN